MKMSKIIENLKSGNYEIVDNQGVSVTIHFIECLEKELAELEAKLAKNKNGLRVMKVFLENQKLKQQLEIYKKALTSIREYMFNVMCAEDVPSEEWFIKCAKENNRLLETIKVKDKEIEKQSEIIQETTKTTYHKLMEKDIIFHLNKHKEELEEQVIKQEKELEYIQKQLEEKEQENRHLKRAINVITNSKYGSLSKDSCKKLKDEEFKNIMQNDVYAKQIKEYLDKELIQENQKLKDKWQEFKNWIDININPIIGQNVYFLHESLLSKMQELEKDD